MIIPEEGKLLLINKPYEWTSFDVVKKLKYLLKPKKIGHAGTLDPLATGLLLIGVNKYTKKLNELQNLDKAYEGIIAIGRTTPSYDLETPFDSEKSIDQVTTDQIEKVRRSFLGEIDQFPPAHSAVKIEGQRAYKKARRNEEVRLKARKVTIRNFKFTKIALPEIHFMVTCSKGTYIRSLAHDFGQSLGVGAYLKSLTRTSIGKYKLEDAENLETLVKKITPAE